MGTQKKRLSRTRGNYFEGNFVEGRQLFSRESIKTTK